MNIKKLKSGMLTMLAAVIGLLWLTPLVWLISTAFSEPSFRMSFLPNTRFTFDNLNYVWNAIPFGQYYINTLTIVAVTFCIQFVTSTLAAY